MLRHTFFTFSAMRALLAVIVVTSGDLSCNPLFGIREAAPPCADPLLIDDLEDGMSDICPTGGRHGRWYARGDGTSSDLTPSELDGFHPTPIDAGADRYAAHFSGAGFTDWGALMGFNLLEDGETHEAYDVSWSDGIQFRLKSSVPVYVNFLVPKASSCTNLRADACSFTFALTAPSPEWTEVTIPYQALPRRDGTTDWSPRLVGISFVVPPGAPFDVWVDDVRFFNNCPSCDLSCLDAKAPVPCRESSRAIAACYPPGTVCSEVPNRCRDPSVIDDLEDGEPTICDTDGRKGWWYDLAGPATATIDPPPGAFLPAKVDDRPPSHYAARMKGSGTTWAVMGFDLAPGPDGYDTRTYGGIEFLMKSDVPVRVGFNTPATSRTTDRGGGTCLDTATSQNCGNIFGFSVVPETSGWAEYRVPFSALAQNFTNDKYFNVLGGSASFDKSRLLQINFTPLVQLSPQDGVGGPFDIWLDDVQFYDCVAQCQPSCPQGTIPCPAYNDYPAACWPEGTDCSRPPRAILYRGWANGPTDVWTVGGDLRNAAGVIRHWNGEHWDTVIEDPSPLLHSVWGSARAQIWAVGDFGTMSRYNGSSWSVASTPAQGPLIDVWGTGADDIWAAEFPRAIWHWDGSDWSLSTTSPAKQISDLWGTGPHDVWVAGTEGSLLHYDGSVWNTVEKVTDKHLSGVWSSSPDDVWAIGILYRDRTMVDSTILHWNGSAWSVDDRPQSYLGAIWGSGPEDIWVVGRDDAGTLILHWNGSTWQREPNPPVRFGLYGVWGSGPSDVYATGWPDSVAHYDGASWSLLPPY